MMRLLTCMLLAIAPAQAATIFDYKPGMVGTISDFYTFQYNPNPTFFPYSPYNPNGVGGWLLKTTYYVVTTAGNVHQYQSLGVIDYNPNPVFPNKVVTITNSPVSFFVGTDVAQLLISQYFDCGLACMGSVSVTTEFTPAAIQTPLPGALPLFLTGLGVLTVLSRRRRTTCK